MKQFIIEKNTLYVVAAGLIILWGFGFMIYNGGILIHGFLLLAGISIMVKMLSDKKTHGKYFPGKKIQKGENPF